MSVQEKRARFRALHERGCFLLPNPWDVGSARLLQHLGFSALASTSSGFAWTTGRPDYGVGLSDVLGHLTTLCEAVDLPAEPAGANALGERRRNRSRGPLRRGPRRR